MEEAQNKNYIRLRERPIYHNTDQLMLTFVQRKYIYTAGIGVVVLYNNVQVQFFVFMTLGSRVRWLEHGR
jgi:hypothetical protein